MTFWMSSAAWELKAGIHSPAACTATPSFSGTWIARTTRQCPLPIFGEVGLNNLERGPSCREKGSRGICHVSFVVRPFLPYTMQPVFPHRGRTKPPEPGKELSEKRADNRWRPPDTMRKLDSAPRGPCHAIPFYHRPHILLVDPPRALHPFSRRRRRRPCPCDSGSRP
jgi:hypothetical protein